MLCAAVQSSTPTLRAQQSEVKTIVLVPDPHNIRDRLFKPFVTAGKQGDLRLGLTLSRRTVLNHGDDIWTEAASGARFVIASL
jgi:C4-dicarboxylate-specific signal transduction histidine kinase